MTVPAYVPLESTLTSIKIQLEALATTQETGGSPIDSYHVEIYNGLAWITISGGGSTDPATYSLDTEVLT